MPDPSRSALGTLDLTQPAAKGRSSAGDGQQVLASSSNAARLPHARATPSTKPGTGPRRAGEGSRQAGALPKFMRDPVLVTARAWSNSIPVVSTPGASRLRVLHQIMLLNLPRSRFQASTRIWLRSTGSRRRRSRRIRRRSSAVRSGSSAAASPARAAAFVAWRPLASTRRAGRSSMACRERRRRRSGPTRRPPSETPSFASAVATAPTTTMMSTSSIRPLSPGRCLLSTPGQLRLACRLVEARLCQRSLHAGVRIRPLCGARTRSSYLGAGMVTGR